MAETMSPQEIVQKQIRNVSNAVPDTEAGIKRVTESPMKKAASKKDKMRANIIKSIDDGSWERGLNRVSLDEWQKKTIEKGIPRIADGIAQSEDKLVAFHTARQAHQNQISAKLARMADLTLQDNINKMIAQVKGMAEFPGY